MCSTTAPPKIEIPGGGSARCHLHLNGPMLQGQPVKPLFEPVEPAQQSPVRVP